MLFLSRPLLKTVLSSTLALTWLAPLPQVKAQNLIVNGSFESGPAFVANTGYPDRVSLPNGSTAITGWVVGTPTSSSGFVWWLREPSYNAEDGNLCIDLDSNENTPFSFIKQTFATTPNQEYKVSAYFASEFNGGPAVTKVSINGQVIGTSTTGSGNLITGQGFNNLIWTEETFLFTADGGLTSTLEFQDDTTASGDNPIIDNVSVESVPDFGSTSLMFSIGLGGLAWFGRSRWILPVKRQIP